MGRLWNTSPSLDSSSQHHRIACNGAERSPFFAARSKLAACRPNNPMLRLRIVSIKSAIIAGGASTIGRQGLSVQFFLLGLPGAPPGQASVDRSHELYLSQSRQNAAPRIGNHPPKSRRLALLEGRRKKEEGRRKREEGRGKHQWPMTNDQWPMTNDRWPMTDDQWPMTNNSPLQFLFFL